MESCNNLIQQAENVEAFLNIFEQLKEIKTIHSELRAISILLISTEKNNLEYKKIRANVLDASAEFKILNTNIEELIANTSEEILDQIYLSRPDLEQYLKAIDSKLSTKLSYDTEKVIERIVNDNFKGWEVVFKQSFYGTTPESSIPRTYYQFVQSENRKQDLIKVLDDNKTYLSATLNNVIGYKSTLYDLKGWEDCRYEALLDNKVLSFTVDNMWNQISEEIELQNTVLNMKESMTHNKNSDWITAISPISSDLKLENINIDLNQAKEHLMKAFEPFDKDLSQFVQTLFNKNWIEAAYSNEKVDDAFCVFLAVSKEPRIYMNYKNTLEDLIILSHEVGHAYHYYKMKDLTVYEQITSVSFDESIALFTEHIMMNYLVDLFNEVEVKRYILERKLQFSSVFLIDIHVRYLFELGLYKSRKHGNLSSDDMNGIMDRAQKKVIPHLKHTFSEYWMIKPHLYNWNASFYNFPYTLGYLISVELVRNLSSQHPLSLSELLEKSGESSFEKLVFDTFNLNLSDPRCWKSTLEAIHSELKQIDHDIRVLG